MSDNIYSPAWSSDTNYRVNTNGEMILGAGVDLTVVQSLTNEQKLTARTNIGAASAADFAELQSAVADLQYMAIDITSFTNSVNTVEVGSTVNSVTLSWRLNKNAATQSIEGETIVGTSKIFEPVSITADKTYTLTVTDDRGASDSASTSITFRNRICYGAAYAGTYDSGFINSIANRVLSSTRARSFDVTAGASKYIFYAIPSRLGTPVFTVGGFIGGFTKVGSEVSCTNASGYTENYDVWKSDNANLGSVHVVVT